MTLSEFRDRYPEFRTATNALVQAMLDDASERIDLAVFGETKGQIAIGLMAAHLLANKPYGRSQRLESGDGDDRYMVELDRLTIECCPTLRVI